MYQSKPTKKDEDVKYIPPYGAGFDNSTLCVANITTPLFCTLNKSKLDDVIKNALDPVCTDPVTLPNIILSVDILNPLTYDAVTANDEVISYNMPGRN